MKPPIFIKIFLIKTEIKSAFLANKYKDQSHKFIRKNSFKKCFYTENSNTFTLFEAHILFCNNSWIIVFILIAYIY